MFLRSGLLFATSLASASLALNDWSKPCHDGECSYDLPSQAGGPVGSLKIWGANKNAITDITPASGWVILGCDPNALKQNVRIVCKGDESDVNGCGHLLQSLGKSGKIVRLPETCGKNAFGRLASVEVDKNQQIPTHVASQLTVHVAGQTRTVRSIVIDTSFKALDVAETGEVNIAVQGSTFPGTEGSLARREARAALFDKLVDKRNWPNFVEEESSSLNSFNISDSTDIPLFSVNKSLNLFNYNISCPAGNGWPAYSATVRGDLHATASAVATIGVAAVGTIVPPDLTEFGLFAALNANLDGQLLLNATASVTADSGLKELYSVDLAGLDWPGILSLGPVFQIKAEAIATLDIDVNLDVSLTYALNNAKFTYPSGSGSGVGVSRGDNALSLSVNPTLSSEATLWAQVQPRIDVGINAIDGAATATVSLIVDASAWSTFTLNAGPTKTVSGCVDVKTNLDIYVGADASFFGLFDDSTTFTLYDTTWDIFNKCFGTTTKRSEVEAPLESREILPRATVSCPAVNVQTLNKLA